MPGVEDEFHDDIVHARGEFKCIHGVSTARLSQEWVEDAPGPTVDVVNVYPTTGADTHHAEIESVADDHGLVEVDPTHQSRGKRTFKRDTGSEQ